MKFTSIRKKIRGMRKKTKKLSEWSEYHKQLDIESLLIDQKTYVKIWINPYYNLYQYNTNKVGKRNPTYKFRKQIFYHLIEIYRSWQEKLEKLNQPYYLKIWLGDPEFIDSQVVAALGTEINYYNEIFTKNFEFKEFPLTIEHPSINKFHWKRCMNGYYVWESDLDSIEEIERTRAKALRIDEHNINGRTERAFFISTGDMWTGYIQGSGNIT